MSKNKNKPMSKNQKVEYMHNATGLSYKECRSLLKANDWDLLKAMGFDDILEKVTNTVLALTKSLKPAIDALCEGCRRLAESVGKALSEVDWKEIAEEAKKIKEVDNNEGEFTNGNDS